MKGIKKWLAPLLVLTLAVLIAVPVLAAPDVGEEYTFDELARFTEYYFTEFFEKQEIWELEDGESMDPKDIPEGQKFVAKSYVDAFKEKADELWAVGDAGDEAIENFNSQENSEARRALYQELKDCAEKVEQNVKTGTRPAALDSLRNKLDNAWSRVDSLTNSYGDAEDSESSARNVHVIWLEDGETVDEAFINEMNSVIPDGHYWIPGEEWKYYWQSEEAMDWIYKTLNDCNAKLEEAENSGSWDGLDGMAELIDKVSGRTQEMRRYLESHLYPKTKPGTAQPPSQSEDSREDSKDKQEEDIPEKIANQVKGSDGKSVVSTLAGVYSARQINGVAVITEKEQAEAAAGLQTPGSRLSLYTCDVPGNNELLQVMSDAAGIMGAQMAGAVKIDLYRIEGNVVNNVRNTQTPLRLVLELPQSMITGNRTFSILIPDGNGGVLELPDLDQDPATITVDAAVFGMWTIIFR